MLHEFLPTVLGEVVRPDSPNALIDGQGMNSERVFLSRMIGDIWSERLRNIFASPANE